MRVIVTGSRHATDVRPVGAALDRTLTGVDARQLLVHGAAPGVDSLADQWARARGADVKRFPADWRSHDREGWSPVPCRCAPHLPTCKAAGPRRNQKMVNAGADLCVAFPGGRGTADMVRRARAAGIRVVHATADHCNIEAEQLTLVDGEGVA